MNAWDAHYLKLKRFRARMEAAGNITMKEWVQIQAQRIGVCTKSIYTYLKRGGIRKPRMFRFNHRVIYVRP